MRWHEGTFSVEICNQSVSLRSFTLFRSAVPVGQPYIFIRTLSVKRKSVFQFNNQVSLRSTGTSQHKKIQQLENKQLYFLRYFVPHLHTVSSCVRSGLCIHNTASFRFAPQATLHYIPAVLCLPPSVFSAVAPSHSHQGWHRSVKTSLCPKSRYTAKKGG